MFVVDYCKGKMDFGRIEIEEGPDVDFEGHSPQGVAAMAATQLEREGYEVIIKEIKKRAEEENY